MLFPSWIIQSGKSRVSLGLTPWQAAKHWWGFFFSARQSCLYFSDHISRRFRCAKKTMPPLAVHSPHNRWEVTACRVLGIPDASRLRAKTTEDLTTVRLQGLAGHCEEVENKHAHTKACTLFVITAKQALLFRLKITGFSRVATF